MTTTALERCTDPVIRAKLVATLRDFYPDARLVQEWPIRSARVDVAVIHRDRIDAYEIKSACDSTTRLAAQQREYSRVFNTCTVVLHFHHDWRVRAIVPSWWGLWHVLDDVERFYFERRAQLNPFFNGKALAQLLWHRELRAIMQRKCFDWRTHRSSWSMADHLSKRVPPQQLTELVCEMLAKRTDWKDINDGASSSHWRL